MANLQAVLGHRLSGARQRHGILVEEARRAGNDQTGADQIGQKPIVDVGAREKILTTDSNFAIDPERLG